MLIKSFAVVLVTVFLAENGDKTQLATMLFAADKASKKWLGFAASSDALGAAARIDVLGSDRNSIDLSRRRCSRPSPVWASC